jgi:hypothetical protein
MKKTKLLGWFLMGLTTITSCTNDAEDMLAPEIKLTSEIMPSRVTSLDYQSTRIVEGQQIGVTITGAKSEHRNIAWTAGANGALHNENSPVYWGETDITVTSYHPYNADFNGTSYVFSVHTDQSANAGYLNSDLLWATKTAGLTDQPIALAFTHQLAKINVTLTSEDIADLSNASIFICGTNIATGFNPATGELSAATSHIAEIKASVTTDKAYTGSAIIVPQWVKKGTPFIKIKINNKDLHYTLPEDMEYKSGHSYNYSLQVKDSNMENPIEGEESEW